MTATNGYRGRIQQVRDNLAISDIRASLPRLLVSSGGVGRAAGADAVITALETAAHAQGTIAVVPTGSTGMTWAEVQVTLQRFGQPDLTWNQVDPGDAVDIVGVASGERSLDSFPPAFVWQSDSLDTISSLDQLPYFQYQQRLLSTHFGRNNPTDVEEALALGAYQGLALALETSPEQIIDAVKKSGIAGRGGAYFPTGVKWEGARRWLPDDGHSYLIVNAEEGEPGVYKDRTLIEGDPHLVLEGTLICAYAIGCDHIFFYLNGEAATAARFLNQAIDAARSKGLIGKSILDTDFACEIEVRLGGGGYVLGEGTALIESVDGKRNMPRLRPPFSDEWGLWDRPTVVQNVETLANVPGVIGDGWEAYSQLGVDGGRGTKLVCIAGNVQRPCVAEIEIGQTLRNVIEGIAGGAPDGVKIGSMLTGGPSGNIVTPDLLDTELVPRSPDVLLGSGNLTAIAEGRSVFELVKRLTRYNAEESCGKCTPCREGVPRMVDILERLGTSSARASDLDDLRDLCDVAASASICGLGQMAPNPITSAIKHFDLDEFATVQTT